MKRRPGAILIIVVVIVMMVSLAAYHFTMSMESEHMAIRNEGDQIMSRQCALSGIDLVGKILEQPRSGRDRLLSIIDHPIDLWPSDSTDEVSYRVTISFPTAERIKSALTGRIGEVKPACAAEVGRSDSRSCTRGVVAVARDGRVNCGSVARLDRF